MTRASLLHILDHVNGISDAEIRELEQLAAAFPYCQTAHVLLAKASHDRGSMLAGQRLRRAATYAADRDLLRQLLEQPVAATVSPTEFVSVTPDTEEQQAAPTDFGIVDGLVTNETGSLVVDVEPQAAETATELPVVTSQNEEMVSAEATLEPQQEKVPTDSIESASVDTTSPDSADTISVPTVLLTAETNYPDQPEAVPTAAPEETPEAADDFEALLPLPAPTEVAAATVLGETVAAATETEVAADDVLPAVAPPIRPPADGGISRFEFGLSQNTLVEPTGYQLPDLEDEDEEDALPTLSGLASPPPPIVTAPFRADEQLGYALGAGSRLGYDLQVHDGYTLDLPLDAFFEPDALLLAHLKAHAPKPAASSLDLINRFLKTQPRIKTPAGRPLPAEEQPDLSVRSTSTAPALASESLAKIMVRQGKKDKAIEIYERLMERQPEKKAYFADQIQQLQQPSE